MKAIKSEDNYLTPEQVLHRRNEFNIWLAKAGQSIGYYGLPSSLQHAVHFMLRKAFNAGSNYEAKMALLENKDEQP